MYYLQNKPSTSFLCLLEPELWSLKDGARAQKTCFFPIFSRSYLRNHTTYLNKNQHTLFSNHVLQPCQISKQSEGVRGKHLLNWHGMTHYSLPVFALFALINNKLIIFVFIIYKLTCHSNVYLAPNSSYSGICCINLANSNIVIDVIRPLNVNAWEKVRSRWATSKRLPNDLIFLRWIFNIISQTFRGSAVNISKIYFFWDTLIYNIVYRI